MEGSIPYKLEVTPTEYTLTVDRTAEAEVVALTIAREILKFNKQNLIKSLEEGQVKGDHLNMVKDRLQKVTTSEYTIGLLIESVIYDIAHPQETGIESVGEPPVIEPEIKPE